MLLVDVDRGRAEGVSLASELERDAKTDEDGNAPREEINAILVQGALS
jgi:hypothetical protein